MTFQGVTQVLIYGFSLDGYRSKFFFTGKPTKFVLSDRPRLYGNLTDVFSAMTLYRPAFGFEYLTLLAMVTCW